MKIVYLIAFILLCSPHAQGQILERYTKDEAEIALINKVEIGEERIKIKRKSKDVVIITFHEGFADTVDVYVNNVRCFHRYLLSDSLALGYSVGGVTIDFTGKPRTASVQISLPDQERYVEFKITRKFPLIKVHHLYGHWYINKTIYVPAYQ